MTCRPSDAVTEDLTLNRDRLDSRGLWRGVYNVAPLQTGGLSTHVHHMFRWAMQRVFGRGHASSQEPHRLCNGKGALYYTAASSGICSRSSLRIQVRRDHVIRPILAIVPGPCLQVPVHLSVQFPTPPSLTHMAFRTSRLLHRSLIPRKAIFIFFASLCLQLCLTARRFCVLTLTGLICSDSLSRLANSAFADHSDETLHPIFLHQRFAWPVATTAPCLPFNIAIGLHFCGWPSGKPSFLTIDAYLSS